LKFMLFCGKKLSVFKNFEKFQKRY
jgi:hypothetical protein